MHSQENGVDPHDAGATETGSSDQPRKPRVDWENANIAVGNSPPLPRWPLGLVTLGWLAWVVFLVVMMLSVVRADAV